MQGELEESEKDIKVDVKKVRIYQMFQRVGVGGDHADRGGPLVVLLVEALVEGGMMEQSDGKTPKVRPLQSSDRLSIFNF